MVRNLPCTVIEADEVWNWLGVKRENLDMAKPYRKHGGDIWLWVALCPKTKLVVAWKLGNRGTVSAKAFMDDLKSRLKHRIQLSTDGHDAYLEAVEHSFGKDIDYARKVRLTDPVTKRSWHVVQVVSGNPDPAHIGTSYVERFNATLRNICRRYFRRTMCFSKNLDLHEYAVALTMYAYNFCRIHGTLKVTPAMEAGITDHIWSMHELFEFME